MFQSSPSLVLQDSPCAAPSPSPCAHSFVLKNSKKPSASQRKDNSMLKRTVKKASHTLNGRSELGHGKGHGKTPTQLTWPVPQQLPQSSAMHAISRHATPCNQSCHGLQRFAKLTSFSVSQFLSLFFEGRVLLAGGGSSRGAPSSQGLPTS